MAQMTAGELQVEMAKLIYKTIERVIALEKQVKELQSGK
jgi:hypothetical protein